jgi:hypothetical protein
MISIDDIAIRIEGSKSQFDLIAQNRPPISPVIATRKCNFQQLIS